MHTLEELLKERISSGLKRKTVTSCSIWAESYRIMGQPFPGAFNFKHHPWSREMHDCKSELMIGQKAAQMAYTETALNIVFYSIDVYGISCLYILPANTPDASDFSTSRFDPALELSPHLEHLFSDVKNIGHKRAGSANLYIRGSRSRSQLKSIPVGRIIGDEIDEMNQDNIPLALERTSGQQEKQVFFLSTPTIDNFGINTYYRNSTQDHYYFKCPRCSKHTELIFPECVVITAEDVTDPRITNTYLRCKECKGRLEHQDKINFLEKAKWISSFTNRASRGFYINQLYSMTVKPWELALSYLKAQTNPADEQEFYNSKLGITHIVEGAKINDQHLENCIGTHKKFINAPPNSFVTIGIDVGKWLHYEVDQFFIGKIQGNDVNLLAICRVLTEGKVLNFEELDQLMIDFGINYAVIDANPERRKALEFAQRFWGHVKLCFYGRGINSKQIHIHAEEEHTITVDRTSWLDLSLSRFRNKKISIPIDTSREYKEHMKALVRIYEKDSDGNPVGKYVKGSVDDHFAHARNYAEIALQLGSGIGQSQNMESVV